MNYGWCLMLSYEKRITQEGNLLSLTQTPLRPHLLQRRQLENYPLGPCDLHLHDAECMIQPFIEPDS